MAASLGTLTLDLIAKIGGFTAGLDAAERASKKSADDIKKNIESIGVAGYAAGNALGQYLKQGIDLAINAFPALIEQAAKFQDIADKTGGSAEGFANFAVSAKVAGVEIETIADASTKLSKNLVGVDDEGKAAGAALKALGINIADFKKLAPDEQIKNVAEAFSGFADGAGKAAVAQQLFGKSGAELLKFFKDYTDNGGDVTILTAKMIQQADDHADAQTRLRAQIQLTLAALSTSAIGPITAFTGAMKEAITQTLGLGAASTDLSNNQGIRIFAEGMGRALAQGVDYVTQSIKELQVLTDFVSQSAKALSQVATLDFAGASQTGADFRAKYGLDEFGRKIANAGTEMGKTFVQRYDAQLAGLKRSAFAAVDPRRIDLGKNGRPTDGRPTLTATAPTKGGSGGADDPTKKLLENELKNFQAMGEQAKELLADRNKILELYNSQGLISVKDYYSAQQANLDEATKVQAKSFDDQIEALKKFQAAASKQTDVADAQGKINKLEEEKAKLYRTSGTAALESSIKQVQAQKAIQDAFDEVNAKILEFNGNLRAAAEIRFDISNEKLLKQAIAEGNDETVKRIGLLKQYTLAQADISKAQEAFALAQGDLSIAEDRITIAQQRGTIGDIEALQKSAEARRAAIAPMQEQLNVLLAINDAVRTPQQNQQIERLKLQLEQLKATADPLGDKFNQIFSDAAGSAFADFITGAKTAKEAFRDFANSVFKSVADLVAKDLAKKLFTSLLGGESNNSTSAGGIGGLLSGLFGSSSGGGAGGAGLFSSLFSGFGFASGGFTGSGAANDPAGIVHKGEYVLNAQETAAIGLDNLQSGRFGGGIVINQSFAPGTNRQTTDQAAQQAGRAIERARRNA